jgi:hypothetical protein
MAHSDGTVLSHYEVKLPKLILILPSLASDLQAKQRTHTVGAVRQGEYYKWQHRILVTSIEKSSSKITKLKMTPEVVR